jgi:type VI secretion system protein VasD
MSVASRSAGGFYLMADATRRWRNGLLALACVLALAACETAHQWSGKALETVGLKKPEPPAFPEIPESAKPARKLKLTLAASDSLNVDASGRSLSLVLRIYKLRSPTTFLNAPYDTFGHPTKEKAVLGDDLLETRELVLLPGQRQQINERWAREAGFVGVVGLFRAPAAKRWRQAFELETFQFDPGFVMGAHACGLSVASGTPIGQSGADLKLSPPTCPTS